MAEETGTPEAEGAEQAESPQQPDVHAMVEQLVDQRMEQFQAQQSEPQPGFGDSVLQSAYGEEPEPEIPALSDADMEMLRQAGVLDDDYGDGQEPELDPTTAAMFDRIQALEAQLAQRSEAETREQLNALTERYPDITSDEIFPELNQRVQLLADKHGEHFASDPSVVEALYHSIKFGAAKASETPAELAATQGTSLEAASGVSNQPEPDLKDEYIKAIRSPGAGSVFV